MRLQQPSRSTNFNIARVLLLPAALSSVASALIAQVPILERYPFGILLAVVTFSAFYGGVYAGLIALALSIFEAFFTLQIYAVDWNVLPIVVLALVSLQLIWFSERLKQETLRATKKERQIDAILSSVTDSFFALDPDFCFTYLNKEAEMYFGETLAELRGRNIFDLVPRARGTIFEHQFIRAMRDREPVRFEAISPLTGRWVEEHVYPSDAGLSVYFRDITERKETEKRLKRLADEREVLLKQEQEARSQAEHRSKVNETVAHIMRELARSTDSSDLRQVICRCARQLLAADGAAFSVKRGGFVQYLNEDSIAPLWVSQQFAAADCLPGWTKERSEPLAIRDVQDDPRARPDLYQSTFVRGLMLAPVGKENPAGALEVYWREPHVATTEEIALLEVLADAGAIALNKAHLYEAATRACNEAENANRAKDYFLATVSHELRNPLTAIVGWMRMIQGHQVGTDAMNMALEVVDRNAALLLHLIEDLLDAARIQTGKLDCELSTLDLESVIRASLDSIQPLAEAKGISLSAEIGELPQIAGNPIRLQQIFRNLLNNSLKFTASGGRIEVTATELSESVEVCIADSGVGIPADLLPKLFQRFSQADEAKGRQGSGLGLGLHLVRHLAELHGGQVHAESAGAGKGTRIYVRFPIPPPSVNPSHFNGQMHLDSGEISPAP